MSIEFEELDFQPTALGDLILRRRGEPRLGGKILYEVKLGEEFLMSSLFTEGEIALARLGLAAIDDRAEIDVAVGGLGLGYTAAAALDEAAVRSLVVVEALPAVIGWHQRELVPLGRRLSTDPRCRMVEGDFFALAAPGAPGFDPDLPGRRFDAVLLDVDHSPRHLLNERHAAFYGPEGLGALANRLRPGGVFALWSNDAPDDDFERMLESVFAGAEAHVVEFANPYTGGQSASTVYVARTGSSGNGAGVEVTGGG